MKRLLLVDGSSYLYRAFHAMPDLRNRAGEPTGAIYGMVNMLRRLRADYKSNFLACVFDAPGQTFRDQIYTEYKATRASMPDDLRLQITPIHEMTAALGWPILIESGVEADDVIGSLACKAIALGYDEVVISTGDKDMTQLVTDRVTLVDTLQNVTLDRHFVYQKFGVYPEQIIDFLALVGDKVDNVPGVDKCGPKTAAKWLAEFGTLDNLIQHADQINGKIGENLRQSLNWLPTAKQLVTIKTDCQFEALVDIDTYLKAKDEDQATLKQLFKRFEFKTWFRQLGGAESEVDSVIDSKPRFNSGHSTFVEFSQWSIGLTQPSSVDQLARPMSLFDAPSTTVASIQTRGIHTQVEFEQLFELLKQAHAEHRIVSVDTETTSLDPLRARLVGLSFSVQAGCGYYIPLRHNDLTGPAQLAVDWVLNQLKPWFENPEAKKVAQNAKYDMHVLANEGITLRGLQDDTLLASYVYEAHQSHGMDALALRWLNHQTLTYESVAGKGAKQICFSDVPIEQAIPYAAEDAEVTFRLNQLLTHTLQPIDDLFRLYRDIEIPFTQVLFDVERHGVLINQHQLREQGEQITRKLAELEQQAHELAGQSFNLNSPKQIGDILFSQLKLPVIKKTASGAPSTNEEVLSQLALDYPLPACLLEHRGLAKLKSTYTDKLPNQVNPITGRVHTNYGQAVAVTGRLVSNDPNLQNIPVRTAEGRRVREAFIAPPGHVLMSADYSQIELRIMAHISEDSALIHAFQQGLDIHNATASEIFSVPLDQVNSEQRRTAKVINFGLIYGMSAFGLAKNLNLSRDAAKLYIDRYFARYPGVAHYMESIREQAKQAGFVKTIFGRRLWLPEINSPNGPRRAAAERAAINAPMQGTSADLIKLAMIELFAWLNLSGLKTKMIMQVHDEVVFEVPEEEVERVRTQVPQVMSSVATLKVPLEVGCGFGKNWQEAH